MLIIFDKLLNAVQVLFVFRSLNPSVSPLSNTGTLAETSKHHFPLPAKASKFK